jgi:hypothetical protein
LAAALVSALPLAAQSPPGAELALERSDGALPAVAVELGGETYRFGLDTGASRTLVGEEVAERLGLAARGRFALAAAGGVTKEGRCAPPPAAALAGFALPIDCLGWVPGERRLAGAGPLDGLLGADALAGVDLWIDLARGRARVAPPGSLFDWVDGEVRPLAPIGRRPAILVELEVARAGPAIARLVLDSGAEGAVLFGELARLAARTSGLRRTPGRLVGATGERPVELVPLALSGRPFRGAAGGWAALLPEVTDRVEDGLLPLAALGPALLDPVNGRVVAGAVLRRAPRPPAPTTRLAEKAAD